MVLFNSCESIVMSEPENCAFSGVFSIAVGVVGASYTGCSRVAAVACFVVGLSLEGAVNAGIALSPLDISPTYAASVMAISSCLAALTGIVAPYLIGVLTPDVSKSKLTGWLCDQRRVLFVITQNIRIYNEFIKLQNICTRTSDMLRIDGLC